MKKIILTIFALMIPLVVYSRYFKKSELIITSTLSSLAVVKLSICGKPYLAEDLKINNNDPLILPVTCGEGALDMVVRSKSVTESLIIELYVTSGMNNKVTIFQDNNSLYYTLEGEFNIL